MKTKEKKSVKVNKRRLAFAVTAIIVLGILVYNIPAIYDFFMYSDYQTVSGLVGGDYRLERYDGKMIAYNNNEMVLINLKGEPVWNVAVSTASPKLCVEDDYILVADTEGKNAYLYDEDELRATIKTEEEISDAALDEKGNIAVAARKHGQKGIVLVYDKNGDKKYIFNSGNGHISALDIHREHIIISQVIADEKGLRSRIVGIDSEENTETVYETKNDEMVYDLRFTEDGEIIAVSDKSLTGYDEDGEKQFKVGFDGRKLVNYNIDSDDNLVFCFFGDRNNSVIESYSQSGKLRGSRTEPGEITNIDVCGEAILISSMRNIKRIYPDGDADEVIVSKHDVKRIKLFGNRRHGFLTGNDSATIVKIKK